MNQACLAHYGVSNGAACLFGGNVAPFVKTPMFVVSVRPRHICFLQGINSTAVSAYAYASPAPYIASHIFRG